MPDRKDLDPAEIPPRILPWLSLVELRERGRRPWLRLVGTEVARKFERDPTGKYIDEIAAADPYRDFVLAVFAEVYRQAAPVYAEGRFRWGDGSHLLSRRIVLPLTSGGDAPDMAVTAHVFGGEGYDERGPLKTAIRTATVEELRQEVLEPA